jgi:FkbH-like protein
MDRKHGAAQADTQQTIAITATFTAEPLAESLAFWMHELDVPAEIRFAPYNQVFQQLLDPSSLLAKNQYGVNVVLLRFEDWQRFETAGTHEKLEQNVHELSLALQSAAARQRTPYLVCVCPPSPSAVADPDVAALFQEMEQRLVSELLALGGVYPLTTAELAGRYPVPLSYDPYGDQVGHIPYTPAFFAALGTAIARKIHAIQSTPYKVIVLDCDQTLWRGVCGEDGAFGVEIDPPRRALQEFMIAQHDAGRLLCLCSKNSEMDVMAVFEHRPEMPLTREHLVSWRINWQNKSENLRDLAQELQLGLDSFVLIDDNPVECAEVQARCPEVLVLQLPQDAARIPAFLDHVWAFDHLKVTAEDRQRTSLYRQNVARERLRAEALTFEEFMTGLGLEVEISELAVHHLARVAQLSQRTNQFNCTTIRRSEGEIQELCLAGDKTCLVVEVRDRFGDYGLVGVMIFAANPEAIAVDTFLLSCRALGRGVERRMLARLGEIARAKGLGRVDVPYVPTPRNRPALDFLQKVGKRFKVPQDQGFVFGIPAEEAAALADNLPAEERAPTSATPPGQAVTTPLVPRSPGGMWPKSARLNHIVRDLNHIARDLNHIVRDLNHIARDLNNVEQILQAIREQKRMRPEQSNAYVAPRTPLEEMLAGIWAEILGLKQVGVNDHFVELGGHSLLAAQILSRVQNTLQVELSLAALFESPTIASLAGCIKRVMDGPPGLQPSPIQRVPREDPLPLSFAQQQLWLVDLMDPGNIAYNIACPLRLSGTLDIAALQQSLAEIARRHESLRTTVALVDGQPVQNIAPASPFALPLVDLSHLPKTGQAAQALYLSRDKVRRPFDLAIGPLWRATLFRLAETEHLLLLTLHHIIGDGWSWGVLLRELATLYQALASGQPSPLPDLLLQYADYAVWQRAWLRDERLAAKLDFWQERLHGAPAVLDLPTDRPRPPLQTFCGARQPLALSGTSSEALKVSSQREGATLFMTLLAAFKALLYKYTGQSDLVVGSPIANRHRSEMEGLIGYFVNTLILRTGLAGDPTFRELLGRVRETVLDAFLHSDLPFEKLVEALQPQRDPSRNPLFQVMFTLQQPPVALTTSSGLTLTQVELDPGIALFDLRLEMTESEQGLIGFVEYNTDLFDQATIAGLLDDFQALLANVIAHPDQPLSKLLSSLGAGRRSLAAAGRPEAISDQDEEAAVARRRASLLERRTRLPAEQRALFEKRLHGKE